MSGLPLCLFACTQFRVTNILSNITPQKVNPELGRTVDASRESSPGCGVCVGNDAFDSTSLIPAPEGFQLRPLTPFLDRFFNPVFDVVRDTIVGVLASRSLWVYST